MASYKQKHKPAPPPGESKYITLVSGDGFEFVLPREAACVSEVIRRMLNPKSGFKEALEGRVTLGEIRGDVLETLAQYWCYNYRYRDAENVPDMPIPVNLCLELLMAADYLDT